MHTPSKNPTKGCAQILKIPKKWLKHLLKLTKNFFIKNKIQWSTLDISKIEPLYPHC